MISARLGNTNEDFPSAFKSHSILRIDEYRLMNKNQALRNEVS